MKKTLLITAGDPLGIGPEITVKALRSPRVQKECRAVVIGEPQALYRAGFSADLAPLIALPAREALPLKPGPHAQAGRLSFQAVKLGIKLALSQKIPLVTAPICKQSWALAGVPFTGHTELLRHATGQEGLMMFTSGRLCCALATEHVAIADLSLTLTRGLIVKRARTFYQTLRRAGFKHPRIGVCALNPHAGDNGQFGHEEKRTLAPALRTLEKEGILLAGPFPADSLWLAHVRGQYDGILCMYHDQALLPLKLAAQQPVVHLTAGLPFTRTSPAHGTAFDIAGQNKADPQSMIAATLTAVSGTH